MSFGSDDTMRHAHPAAVTCFGPEESADCCIDSVKPETGWPVCIITAFASLVSDLIHHPGINRNTNLMIGLGKICRLLTSPLLKARVDSVPGSPLAAR